MGERTTWAIKTESGENVIWLYSHWLGAEKLAITKQAIEAAMPRARVGDTAYAARIFISHIVGDDWSSETGFGITTGFKDHCPFEESYDPVLIDFFNGSITYGAFTFSIPEFLDNASAAIEMEQS